MAFRTSIMLVVITLIHLVGAKSKEFCDEKKSDKRPTGGAEICLQGQLGFGQLVAAIFEKKPLFVVHIGTVIDCSFRISACIFVMTRIFCVE